MTSLDYENFHQICKGYIESLNKKKIVAKNEIFLMQKNPLFSKSEVYPDGKNLFPIRI